MKYYYIYKITCTTGSLKDHYYIGQHKTSTLDDGYKGSGVMINKYYKKHPNDYVKEILCWCKDENELNEKEDFYVGDLYETDSMCLNLRAGGNQPGISEETRRKHSESMKGKIAGEKHPRYGKPVPDEQRKKQSKSMKGKMVGENHPNYGKHWPEETIQKMSEASKNISEETHKKMSENHADFSGKNNPAYGRKWMNNGIITKYVKEDEIQSYLELGYSLGRLKK